MTIQQTTRQYMLLSILVLTLATLFTSCVAPLPFLSRGSGSGGGAAGGKSGAADGGSFSQCQTCVFVVERIKKGTNMLLPSICDELYQKYPDSYSFCHQTLNALQNNGNNVRYWLFEGCYKYEIYQAKEWVKPCPSHVICSVLKNLKSEPFCEPLPMENPFTGGGGGAAGKSAGGAGGALAGLARRL